MAHMNEEQKQKLRDAVKEGKTIQYRKPYWVDYGNVAHSGDFEEAMNNRELEWQVKPPPQVIGFTIPKL